MATLRSVLPEDLAHPEAAPQYIQSALYLGTGTGRMLEAARLAGLHATDWTFGVRFADLDLDGRLDVHFTNGMIPLASPVPTVVTIHDMSLTMYPRYHPPRRVLLNRPLVHLAARRADAVITVSSD